MNKVEVGKLLTIASGFDRFITVDRVTTEAWSLALSAVDFDDAQAVVLEHYVGPSGREALSVRHIIAATALKSRHTRELIEVDVRSAKARGLLPADHPAREPLPGDIARRLTAARENDRAEAVQYGEIQPAEDDHGMSFDYEPDRES